MGFYDPAAGIEDVLKIGLQLPPAGELEAVGQLDHRLARPDRVKRPAEAHDIAVESPCRIADPGIAGAEPDLVVGTAEGSFVDQPAIDIEIDEVAVARRAHRASEYVGAGMVGLVEQEWLIDNRVEAEIIAVLARPAIAVGARQRDAVRIQVQVAKPLGIPPATKAV